MKLLRIMNVLGRTHSCMIGCAELFHAWPWVLNMVYLSTQETNCICHLPANMGHIMSDLTIEFWVMCPKVSLPIHFTRVKSFLMASW